MLKMYHYLLSLAFCCATFAFDGKIKIDILEKAEKCEFKSKKGDTMTWKYRGTQVSGEQFSQGTFTAILGENKMVDGIDQGMYDMCVGEKRRLTIPPQLGYKSQGFVNIYFYNDLLELSRDGKVLATVMPKVLIQNIKEVKNCDYRSKEGDHIYWHYKGLLESGDVFEEGDYNAVLGAGTIIKGVNDGMLDMCVGEIRKLIVPPHLAYGDDGTNTIPAGATLTFINRLHKIDTMRTQIKSREL